MRPRFPPPGGRHAGLQGEAARWHRTLPRRGGPRARRRLQAAMNGGRHACQAAENPWGVRVCSKSGLGLTVSNAPAAIGHPRTKSDGRIRLSHKTDAPYRPAAPSSPPSTQTRVVLPHPAFSHRGPRPHPRRPRRRSHGRPRPAGAPRRAPRLRSSRRSPPSRPSQPTQRSQPSQRSRPSRPAWCSRRSRPRGPAHSARVPPRRPRPSRSRSPSRSRCPSRSCWDPQFAESAVLPAPAGAAPAPERPTGAPRRGRCVRPPAGSPTTPGPPR